ncbi:hypothetical protein ABVF16_005004 [Salmonella enterica]|nr:hypothetical protein [Salmonella enterica]EDT0682293.1 hypothetical protein [Salmonella enterica subsp. enterica serovar Urbana]EBA7282889.1 hypothetical protein [Salmonella enterica]ECO5144399.1 hypothetical protein [Salmonella enterica]EGA9862558.1 hypothetical protein [Salmonella enterica]
MENFISPSEYNKLSEKEQKKLLRGKDELYIHFEPHIRKIIEPLIEKIESGELEVIEADYILRKSERDIREIKLVLKDKKTNSQVMINIINSQYMQPL